MNQHIGPCLDSWFSNKPRTEPNCISVVHSYHTHTTYNMKELSFPRAVRQVISTLECGVAGGGASSFPLLCTMLHRSPHLTFGVISSDVKPFECNFFLPQRKAMPGSFKNSYWLALEIPLSSQTTSFLDVPTFRPFYDTLIISSTDLVASLGKSKIGAAVGAAIPGTKF